MLPWFWYAVWLGAPLLLCLRSRAYARATVTTVVLTGLVGAVAWHYLCPDDFGGSLEFTLSCCRV